MLEKQRAPTWWANRDCVCCGEMLTSQALDALVLFLYIQLNNGKADVSDQRFWIHHTIAITQLGWSGPVQASE